MTECEWCGHPHERSAICSQRPKARGMGRRSFLSLFGVGIAGMMANPSWPVSLVQTGTTLRGANPNIGQEVANAWAAIIGNPLEDNIFNEYSFLAVIEKKSHAPRP